MTKVVILGGGVAGMSAAQELGERGFAVEVLEKRPVAGGKARSITVVEPEHQAQPGAIPWLPGEHGFRFFPGFYKHVVDTMARIPFGRGRVADNLVETTRIQIARFGRRSLYVPARFPQSPVEAAGVLQDVLALMSGELGIPYPESLYFLERVWQVLTSCPERRNEEYEQQSWWDFIGAASRSEAYRTFYGQAITRSLVAAKAARASTKTIGNIFLQILLYVVMPGVSTDRVLNGPTNSVWIEPWLDHLESLGVSYRRDTEVVGLAVRGGRVRAAIVDTDLGRREVEGDHFLIALPIERVPPLLSRELLTLDPALENIRTLADSVEWMNGIQLYLTEDVPLVHGHTIFLDSPWALTSVSQPQFWRGIDLRRFGDGAVRGILSIDISNWTTAGLCGKPAVQCTREEILREVWEQVKASVNNDGRTLLRDDMLHSWFLDPDIVDEPNPATPQRFENMEPLLVNYVDTWRLRPEAVTAVPNLFLASDYVRTHTDLATMEGANEAARRAANGILAASGGSASPCAVWPLQEPTVFEPLKQYDSLRYRSGLPWDGGLTCLARPVAELALRSAWLEGGAVPAPSPTGNAPGASAPVDPTPPPSGPRFRIIPR